ncbi:hypothetical protein GF402_03930 [Candidatus Fermentibacteria bacterium]|nr:hypothetical protein [Candidatus Fermentibacteria bacterium]
MIRVALMLSIASICLAATLHVPGDYPTIQEAIAAVEDGDTVLVGPGSYGGPISFRGKNIVVRSEYGPGPTDIHWPIGNWISGFIRTGFSGPICTLWSGILSPDEDAQAALTRQ